MFFFLKKAINVLYVQITERFKCAFLSSQQNFTNFGIIDIEITRIYFPDSVDSEKEYWLCYNCPFLL